MLRNSHNGNWIINLFVLLCNLNIIISQCYSLNKDTDYSLPINWPSQWNNGTIPFMFNFYSMPRNRKRLISLVKTAHSYIEHRSCLVFVEHDPRKMSKIKNFTYIYYVFSGALEDCCLTFYKNDVGRRIVLITPLCGMPGEIAHVTLHGMGLQHNRHESFIEYNVKSVLFVYYCEEIERKLETFNKS